MEHNMMNRLELMKLNIDCKQYPLGCAYELILANLTSRSTKGGKCENGEHLNT